MTRAQNSGINEFPISIDFFDNPSICAVTVEHGAMGQAATIMLLYAIYRNGYFIEWTPENCVVLLKELPGIKIKKMEKIVKTLVEWGFFDREIFEQHQVLTNRDIQQHFRKAAQPETLPTKDSLPYWLKDEPDNEENIMEASDSQDEDNSNTPVNVNVLGDMIMNDEQWMKEMCAKNQMDRAGLLERIDKFSIESIRRGKVFYNSLDEAKNSFCKWLSTRPIP